MATVSKYSFVWVGFLFVFVFVRLAYIMTTQYANNSQLTRSTHNTRSIYTPNTSLYAKQQNSNISNIITADAFNRQTTMSPQHKTRFVEKLLDRFSKRSDLGTILNQLDKRVGAELGVQTGRFAYTTLNNWHSVESYHLIDAWTQQPNYHDNAIVNIDKHNGYFKETQDRMARFRAAGVDIPICRNFTTVCVDAYPDNYFDYIYVDARHDFKGVYIDLTQWWPKLKDGGIFAGHDYVTQAEGPTQSGQDWTLNFDGTIDATGTVVKGAVNKFAKERGLKVWVGRSEAWPTWVVVKQLSVQHKHEPQVRVSLPVTRFQLTNRSCGSKQDVFKSMAVVLASDNAYMPCTFKLVLSIVNAGKWNGDIILLVAREFVMTGKIEEFMATFCVDVRRVDTWVTNILLRGTLNPNGSKWLRMHMFTDSFFRKYETLLYMDVDGIVQHDILGVFGIADTNTVVMRDNGMGISKGTLLKDELFPVKFGHLPNQGGIAMSDTAHPGASNFLLVNMKKIAPPSEISAELYDLVARYGIFFRYADQSLINLYFRREYSVMAPCIQDIRIVHPDNSRDVSVDWYRKACLSTELIYVHDHAKICM